MAASRRRDRRRMPAFAEPQSPCKHQPNVALLSGWRERRASTASRRARQAGDIPWTSIGMRMTSVNGATLQLRHACTLRLRFAEKPLLATLTAGGCTTAQRSVCETARTIGVRSRNIPVLAWAHSKPWQCRPGPKDRCQCLVRGEARSAAGCARLRHVVIGTWNDFPPSSTHNPPAPPLLPQTIASILCQGGESGAACSCEPVRAVRYAPPSDCRTGVVAIPPRPPRSTPPFSPLPARAPPGELRSGDSAALRGEASGEPRGVVIARPERVANLSATNRPQR